ESVSHVHQTKSSPLASDQPLWSPRRLKNANDCASRSAATATWPLGATRTKYRSVLRGMSSLETSCTSGAGDATALEGAADELAAEELDTPGVAAFSGGTVHANSTTATSQKQTRTA